MVFFEILVHGKIRLFSAYFYMAIFDLANDNLLTNRRKSVTLIFIRVAARFFSGVPHPHLLGVCCPDFQTAKPRSKT
jgi:hypothetical protein